jgi:hypothetical protein
MYFDRLLEFDEARGQCELILAFVSVKGVLENQLTCFHHCNIVVIMRASKASLCTNTRDFARGEFTAVFLRVQVLG